MDESSEVDPFLSGARPTATTNSDYHSRQESGDSGLGMGPFPSMPNTPEDFLSIDDNMDTISGPYQHNFYQDNLYFSKF